jgi:AraC-like DNA-binding protein
MKEIVLIEIKARLQRMSAGFPDEPGGADLRARGRSLNEGPLNKVEQIACFVAQHYTEPLRVGDICAALGLDSDYAMTLSKKVFGMTLVKYLTHHRVAHAKRLLSTTWEKVVDVAFESGFSSVSAFNEAFRRSSGCSPREYRSHIDRGDFVHAIKSRRSLGRIGVELLRTLTNRSRMLPATIFRTAPGTIYAPAHAAMRMTLCGPVRFWSPQVFVPWKR